MSFNIRNIREIPNDPFAKFGKHLSKELSKIITKQQTDKLENKEDIYSAGQDVDTAIKYHSELSSVKSFDFANPYYSPSEPDGDKVTLWIQGNNLGDELNDISGFENHGLINGDPVLVDGDPFDYGIKTGGTKSIAIRLNRPTSDFENEEYISIPDTSNIQISGISIGVSYFIRFKINSLSTQGGNNRTLFEKIDDSTPNNGVVIKITPDGELIAIIRRSGTDYKQITAASTISINTVYEIWITYTVSGNVIHVYVNNVDETLSTSTDTPNFHSTLTNHDLSVFRRGAGSNGYLYGDLYDFMIFREKVVSSTEVGHHYANKWTLADILFGQVMVSNYWATYIVLPDTFPAVQHGI